MIKCGKGFSECGIMIVKTLAWIKLFVHMVTLSRDSEFNVIVHGIKNIA